MQNQKIFYGISRNSQNPLDERVQVNSLSTLSTELKKQYRYSGLIFHVADINKWYGFLNDLETPIDLLTYFNQFGLSDAIICTDYSLLTNKLNATGTNLGKIVTVFPLGVSFIYDGTNWIYYSGTYFFVDNNNVETLPTIYKKNKATVIVGNNVVMFDSSLNLSSFLINVTDFPLVPEKGRYYKINQIVYYYSDLNSWSKMGCAEHKEKNINLYVGNNLFTHNLYSENIQAKFIISQINKKNQIVDLEIEIIDNLSINIVSELPVVGELIITTF